MPFAINGMIFSLHMLFGVVVVSTDVGEVSETR